MKAKWTTILLGVLVASCSSGGEVSLREVETELDVSPSLKQLVIKNEIVNSTDQPARVGRFVRSCSCQRLTLAGEALREGAVIEPGQSKVLRLELGSHSVNTLHDVMIEFGRRQLTWRVRVRVDYDINSFAPAEDLVLAVGEAREIRVRFEAPEKKATEIHRTSRSESEAECASSFELTGEGEYVVTLRGHREGRRIRRLDFRSADGRTVRPVILRWRVASGLRAEPSILAARKVEFEQGFERTIVLRRSTKADGRKWDLDLECSAPGLQAQLVSEKPGSVPTDRSVVVRLSSTGEVSRGALLLRDKTSGTRASVQIYPAQ